MSSSAYLAHAGPFRTTGSISSSNAFPSNMAPGTVSPYDRDPRSKQVGTPYARTPSPVAQVLIRRLPLDINKDNVRMMVVFSKELVDVEMLAPEQSDDAGFRSAVLKFKSRAGAQQAQEMLHGKCAPSSDVDMVVDLLPGSPMVPRRYPLESTNTSTSISSSVTSSSTASSSGTTSRHTSRFNGAYQPMDNITTQGNGTGMGAGTGTGPYSSTELPNPESSTHYQSLFSPQSPIGNHLTDRGRISGKTLINHDPAEDDETRELLKDPVAYAENGATQQRRATAPHLPISRIAKLSLNTNPTGPASVSHYNHGALTPISAHTNAHGNMLSSTVPNSGNPNHGMNYMNNQHFRLGSHLPPMNPADQNPPCNTLYVGNLPIDTNEDELKALFSKQRGYKRLCFRTKSNGPMCFVEFEDISFATKTLNELYGFQLHNSVKGGIRLSFSKNPLGVRPSQAPGQTGASPANGINSMMTGSGSGFTTASHPPPGLTAPPGLNRTSHGVASNMSSGASTPYSTNSYSNHFNNTWSSPIYSGSLSASAATGPSAYPPYMMGR